MSKKTETLLQAIMREPDFQDVDDFVIIGIKGNQVWHCHQGNPMHLIQAVETTHESLKKEVLRAMMAKISKMIEDEDAKDDSIKMELAKAETLQALKNITKH
jgi:hypothetical protein